MGVRARKLTRRSFLGRVAGGVAAGALAGLAGGARAHPYSDNDPTDGVGRGRNRSGGQFPYSDTDVGRNSDPVGRAGRLAHFNDTDRILDPAGGDPVNHGRRYSCSRRPSVHRLRNITDTDQGQYADPPGHGRRPARC
ncbi:MAG TPA: hypothetical protein VGW40_15425 [Allosphingosinicella sp.]|nr:hypothetical protein [Allosphingosinicella sp.]